MRRHQLLTGLCLISSMGLIVSGCRNSDSKKKASSTAQEKRPATTTQPTQNSGGTKVTMEGFQFSPKELTVKVGDTVTWENKDSAPHNAAATAGATFKSKDFGQGETFSWTAKKAGTISYECTLHPGMEAKITVTG